MLEETFKSLQRINHLQQVEDTFVYKVACGAQIDGTYKVYAFCD